MPSTDTSEIRLWIVILEKPMAERGDNIVWGTLLCFDKPESAMQCLINQQRPAIKSILPCVFGRG